MNRTDISEKLRYLFKGEFEVNGNFVVFNSASDAEKQQHTNDSFSDKWSKYSKSTEREVTYQFQRNWYLTLYGFADEAELRDHLRDCTVIFDAGCGLGYKSAWLAELAPHALIIGMDFSEAVRLAAETYAEIPNLFFIQGDIVDTGFHDGVIDYVNCDQVIMHTENPEKTFEELVRISRKLKGEIACYFYAKKALPRELLDEHFRTACRNLSSEELWDLSEQLAELGRRLSELNVEIESPDIPAMGIKGGKYDIQRFIYWNFLKCFWNEELGRETSIATNFDWYSPSNARRFSREEVQLMIDKCGLASAHFHSEEACYSGRFVHADGTNS